VESRRGRSGCETQRDIRDAKGYVHPAKTDGRAVSADTPRVTLDPMPETVGREPHKRLVQLRMHIALVGSADEGRGCGLGALAAALTARGHTVTVYLRCRGMPMAEGLNEQDGYRVAAAHVGDEQCLPDREALPLMGEFAGYLNRAWKRDPPDVVHGYGWLPGVAAQLAARRQRLRTVQTFHGLATPKRTYGGTRLLADAERAHLEPLLARGAAWVTVGCTADLGALSRLRRARERLSLVPGGVDAERFNPVGPAIDRGSATYRVVCLARNALHLNEIAHVMRAVHKLSGAELLVGETGPDDAASQQVRQHLRRFAEELGAEQRVNLLGYMRPDELPALLRSADVVACTPRSAPDATALQAMASGVAVVAADVDALSDVVVDGVTGFLVSAARPDELAAGLKTLHAQPFRREGMGAAGRARARSRYSWTRVAVDTESVYYQVAMGPTPADSGKCPAASEPSPTGQ
jgi:glycosyltransferase involved in cell wall biosynthesis